MPQLQLLLRGAARTVSGAPARQAAADRVPGTSSGRSTPPAGERHEIRVLLGEPTERPLPRDPPSRPVSSTGTGYGSKGDHPHRLRSVIRQVSCRNAGSPTRGGWPSCRQPGGDVQIIRFCCRTLAACPDRDLGVVACRRWRVHCHIGAAPGRPFSVRQLGPDGLGNCPLPRNRQHT